MSESELDGLAELGFDVSRHEGFERLAGFGEDELGLGFDVVEFEAFHVGGDPDLGDGGVGGDDEFGGRIVEFDGEGAGVEVDVEAERVGGGAEGVEEIGEGAVGGEAELGFVEHNWLLF
jgi:hypothetical protein